MNNLQNLFIKIILMIIICSFNTNIYPNKNQENINFILNERIKNISLLSVDFKQTDTNNQTSSATMLIQKPFKFRVNYYPPFPIVIIGNKNYTAIYDYEFDSFTRIKPSENIFNFLVEKTNNPLKGFSILSSKKTEINKINYYKVSLIHKISSKKFDIYFNTKGIFLDKMIIFEEDGEIKIDFSNPQKLQNIKST